MCLTILSFCTCSLDRQGIIDYYAIQPPSKFSFPNNITKHGQQNRVKIIIDHPSCFENIRRIK